MNVVRPSRRSGFDWGARIVLAFVLAAVAGLIAGISAFQFGAHDQPQLPTTPGGRPI